MTEGTGPASILWLTQIGPELEPMVGGKAAGLARLLRHGLPVPEGFVLTREAYQASVRLEDAERPPDFRISPELRTAIVAAYRKLALAPPGAPAGLVAVRSSARGEDGAGRSFAGVYDSYLSVASEAELLDRIAECWLTLHGERAVAYRQGPPSRDDFMGVIVQRQVEAECAGVAFTVDPTRPGSDCVLVEIVAGLAETLVSGEDEGVQYRIPRDEALRSSGGEAPGETDRMATIAREVASLGLRYEQAVGEPQDVEWVKGPDGVVLVQARPIPGGSLAAGPESPEPERPLPPGFRRELEEPFSVFGAWLEAKKASRYERAVRRIKGPGYRRRVLFHDDLLHVAETTPPWGRAWESAVAILYVLFRSRILHRHERVRRAYHEDCARLRRDIRAASDPVRMQQDLGKLVETYLRYAGEESIAAGHLANLEAALLARTLRLLRAGDGTRGRALLVGAPSVSHQRDLRLWETARQAGPDVVERSRAEFEEEYGYVFADSNPKDPGWRIDAERRESLLGELRKAGEEASPASRHATQLEQTEQARRDVEHRIDRLPLVVRPWGRALARWAVRSARESLPLRESRNHDFYLGIMSVREGLLALGQALAAQNRLQRAEHASGLSYDELGKAARGEDDLRSLAAQRASRADRRRARPAATGPPRHGDRISDLKGIPASSGVVRGVARVILNWQDAALLQSGEVLVCPAIRPYLTPVLLLASALVTDRGSALSHGANLAREYGIPAVLATGEATETIHTGDPVLVDGDRGMVEILREAREVQPGKAP